MQLEELKTVLQSLESKLGQSPTEAKVIPTTKQITTVPKTYEGLLHKLPAPEEAVHNWLAKQVRNKVFLDYGCRSGKYVVASAHMGAALAIGLDIEVKAIEEAKKKVEANCFFIQGDCENSGLPGESVDCILAKGILGKVDLSFALPELRRILKPGGKILVIEAWEQNPMAKVYHRIVKDKPLNQANLDFAKKFFDITNINYYQVFMPAIQFIPGKNIKTQFGKVAQAIDHLITQIPGIKNFAWQITFELTKPR